MFARLHLRRSTIVALLVALAMIATMSTAFAAKGGGGRGSGGGGGAGGQGGGGETTVANNLSVPSVFVGGSTFTGVTCDEVLTPPTGTPLDNYEVAGYYYVQGVHKWQAQCTSQASATATADWGDNLTGDASLRVGSPIRVEVGLLEGSLAGDVTTPSSAYSSLQGYDVIKLQPSTLDRESAYGTLATQDGATGAWSATAKSLGEVRVYDSTAKFSIQNVTTGTYVVGSADAPVTMTAEINATGRVVYGYNLRVTTAGTYEIKFYAPNVTLNNADDATTDAHMVSLRFDVAGSAGGGGGGNPNR